MNEPQHLRTDAEIESAWTEATGCNIFPYPDEMLAFARTVLAKWGTPSPKTNQCGEVCERAKLCAICARGLEDTTPSVGVEPIGYLYCGGSYGDELEDWEFVADQHQCDKLNEYYGALGKEAKISTYITPQPTQAQAGAVPLICEWAHNEDDGFWDTECGQSWRFDDGGPKENHMNFCHCCGKPLRIKGGQHGAEH